MIWQIYFLRILNMKRNITSERMSAFLGPQNHTLCIALYFKAEPQKKNNVKSNPKNKYFFFKSCHICFWNSLDLHFYKMEHKHLHISLIIVRFY